MYKDHYVSLAFTLILSMKLIPKEGNGELKLQYPVLDIIFCI